MKHTKTLIKNTYIGLILLQSVALAGCHAMPPFSDKPTLSKGGAIDTSNSTLLIPSDDLPKSYNTNSDLGMFARLKISMNTILEQYKERELRFKEIFSCSDDQTSINFYTKIIESKEPMHPRTLADAFLNRARHKASLASKEGDQHKYDVDIRKDLELAHKIGLDIEFYDSEEIEIAPTLDIHLHDPQFVQDHHTSANLYRSLKEYTKALIDLNRGIKWIRDDINTLDLTSTDLTSIFFEIDSFRERGEVRQILGDNIGAIDDFNQYLKYESKLSVGIKGYAYHRRAISRLALSDFQGAKSDLLIAKPLLFDANYIVEWKNVVDLLNQLEN